MNKTVPVVFVTVVMLSMMLITGCQTNNNVNANRSTNSNSRSGDWDLSREDFEKAKDRFEKEARELGRKVGNGSDDLWLWTKTRSALAYTEDLRDSTINVDVDNNVITLSGTVANDAQKAKAEEIARSIEGVKSVTSNLQVSQGGDSANRNAR